MGNAVVKQVAPASSIVVERVVTMVNTTKPEEVKLQEKKEKEPKPQLRISIPREQLR